MRLTITAGGFPRWSADGRQVFYCGADSLTVVDVNSPGDPGMPQDLFSWPWFNLWAIDSKRQWFLRPMATEAAEPINVVLNWTAGLRKK